jgi:uncharacterized protein
MTTPHDHSRARQCGECSLCCKLPAINELNKPANTWCRHVDHDCGGCSIYQDRPSVCRGFTCGWLEDLDFGDEWFPAISKMVITSPPLCVNVDPAFPNAWKLEPYYSQLKKLARKQKIWIRVGWREFSLSTSADLPLEPLAQQEM